MSEREQESQAYVDKIKEFDRAIGDAETGLKNFSITTKQDGQGERALRPDEAELLLIDSNVDAVGEHIEAARVALAAAKAINPDDSEISKKEAALTVAETKHQILEKALDVLGDADIDPSAASIGYQEFTILVGSLPTSRERRAFRVINRLLKDAIGQQAVEPVATESRDTVLKSEKTKQSLVDQEMADLRELGSLIETEMAKITFDPFGTELEFKGRKGNAYDLLYDQFDWAGIEIGKIARGETGRAQDQRAAQRVQKKEFPKYLELKRSFLEKHKAVSDLKTAYETHSEESTYPVDGSMALDDEIEFLNGLIETAQSEVSALIRSEDNGLLIEILEDSVRLLHAFEHANWIHHLEENHEEFKKLRETTEAASEQVGDDTASLETIDVAATALTEAIKTVEVFVETQEDLEDYQKEHINKKYVEKAKEIQQKLAEKRLTVWKDQEVLEGIHQELKELREDTQLIAATVDDIATFDIADDKLNQFNQKIEAAQTAVKDSDYKEDYQKHLEKEYFEKAQKAKDKLERRRFDLWRSEIEQIHPETAQIRTELAFDPSAARVGELISRREQLYSLKEAVAQFKDTDDKPYEEGIYKVFLEKEFLDPINERISQYESLIAERYEGEVASLVAVCDEILSVTDRSTIGGCKGAKVLRKKLERLRQRAETNNLFNANMYRDRAVQTRVRAIHELVKNAEARGQNLEYPPAEEMTVAELADEILRDRMDPFLWKEWKVPTSSGRQREVINQFIVRGVASTYEGEPAREVDRIVQKVRVQLVTLDNQLQVDNKAAGDRSQLYTEAARRVLSRRELLIATTYHPEWGQDVREMLMFMVKKAALNHDEMAVIRKVKDENGKEKNKEIKIKIKDRRPGDVVSVRYEKSLDYNSLAGEGGRTALAAGLDKYFGDYVDPQAIEFANLLFTSFDLLSLSLAELQKQTRTRSHNAAIELHDVILESDMTASMVHRTCRYGGATDDFTMRHLAIMKDLPPYTEVPIPFGKESSNGADHEWLRTKQEIIRAYMDRIYPFYKHFKGMQVPFGGFCEVTGLNTWNFLTLHGPSSTAVGGERLWLFDRLVEAQEDGSVVEKSPDEAKRDGLDEEHFNMLFAPDEETGERVVKVGENSIDVPEGIPVELSYSTGGLEVKVGGVSEFVELNPYSETNIKIGGYELAFRPVAGAVEVYYEDKKMSIPLSDDKEDTAVINLENGYGMVAKFPVKRTFVVGGADMSAPLELAFDNEAYDLSAIKEIRVVVDKDDRVTFRLEGGGGSTPISYQLREGEEKRFDLAGNFVSIRASGEGYYLRAGGQELNLRKGDHLASIRILNEDRHLEIRIPEEAAKAKAALQNQIALQKDNEMVTSIELYETAEKDGFLQLIDMFNKAIMSAGESDKGLSWDDIMSKSSASSKGGLLAKWFSTAGRAKMFGGRHLRRYIAPFLLDYCLRLMQLYEGAKNPGDMDDLADAMIVQIKNSALGGLSKYKDELQLVINALRDPEVRLYFARTRTEQLDALLKLMWVYDQKISHPSGSMDVFKMTEAQLAALPEKQRIVPPPVMFMGVRIRGPLQLLRERYQGTKKDVRDFERIAKGLEAPPSPTPPDGSIMTPKEK